MPGPSTVDGNIENAHSVEHDQISHSIQHLQLWLVDLVSGQNMELFPSREWLRSKVDNARYDEVAHRMAKLKHPWRTAILDFVRSRNDRRPPHLAWKLCFIGLPRRVSKLALFGHRRGDCLVRLVLCQQKFNEGDSNTFSPWEEPNLNSPDEHAAVIPHTRISPKTVMGQHSRRPRSALKHFNENKGEINGTISKIGSREVSFSEDGDSNSEPAEFGTIRIERENFGEGISRGTTLIDSVVFPAEALREISLPWRKLEKEIDGQVQEFIHMPVALSNDEIEKLKQITMRKIVEGEGKLQ